MSSKAGPNWAFRIMAFIHDNALRRRFSDPYQTLENAGLRSGQKVLEVGCGPGFFTIPAARIVTETGKVYALDIHPLAIERVQTKISTEQITNVEPILASITSTGFPKESFDLAFLFGVPRIIRNDQFFNETLIELHRILRPNGIISIKTSQKNIIEKVEEFDFTYLRNKEGIHLFSKVS
ncbi:MAG: class I SAM-dependent methyltransferase [Promethearchaeota archaeon]